MTDWPVLIEEMRRTFAKLSIIVFVLTLMVSVVFQVLVFIVGLGPFLVSAVLVYAGLISLMVLLYFLTVRRLVFPMSRLEQMVDEFESVVKSSPGTLSFEGAE